MPALEEESFPDTDCGCLAPVLLLCRCLLCLLFLFTLDWNPPPPEKEWNPQSERMIRKGEVLRVYGWDGKIGGIIREERVGVGKAWGDNTSWVREWRRVAGSRERESRARKRELLTAWETLRCHLAWGGPKDRVCQPLTQIPLLANIQVVQIYGLPRNNNCQTPEDKRETPPRPQVNRAWILVQTHMIRTWCLTQWWVLSQTKGFILCIYFDFHIFLKCPILCQMYLTNVF